MKRRRFFSRLTGVISASCFGPVLVDEIQLPETKEVKHDTDFARDYVHLDDPEGGEWRITLDRDYADQTIRFYPVLHIDQDLLEAKGIDVWSDEAIQYCRERYKAMRDEIGEAIMEWALKEGLTTMKLPLHNGVIYVM